MTRLKFGLLTAAGIVAASAAYAAGMFPGIPLVGSTGYATFTGLEIIPADTQQVAGIGPATVAFKATAFGQGAIVTTTTPQTGTIPANTPLYILNGAQGSAFTLTMPPSPSPGDIQRVSCQAATVGALTVAANTGQTLTVNPAAACVAGVTYAWLYNGPTATWQRIQ